jgi:hypothetical protein
LENNGLSKEMKRVQTSTVALFQNHLYYAMRNFMSRYFFRTQQMGLWSLRKLVNGAEQRQNEFKRVASAPNVRAHFHICLSSKQSEFTLGFE